MYSYQQNMDNSTIQEFLSDESNIASLQLTVEQFEVLNSLTLNVPALENAAFFQRNWNLILYLAKHHQLECNLCLHDNPMKCLGDRGIVTVYNPNADYDTMISNGYIPYKSGNFNHDKVVELYKDGYTDEEILFIGKIGIYDLSILTDNNIYNYISSYPFWSIVTKSYLEEQAKRGDSYAISFFNVDMLYKSMRPKTDMSMFVTANSNIYSIRPPKRSIPVTRYGEGMSQGLYYHSERPKDICGYFYYLEKESETYLEYKTSFVSSNKLSACVKLLDKLPNSYKSEIMNAIEKMGETHLYNYLIGEYPGDLMISFTEYQKYDPTAPTSNRKFYIGDRPLILYGREDELDQPLCKSARYLGYDIVVLTNMVGSHQVVTEVLDTRDDSYSNLWFKR